MMMATNLIAEEESLSTFDLPMDVPKESAVLCNTKVGISEVALADVIYLFFPVHIELPFLHFFLFLQFHFI